MSVVNWVLAAVSFAGSVIAIWELWRYVQDRDRLTWRVTENCMKDIIGQMRRKNYKPDMVIGVGRGGAIVGGMLAGNLGHVPLFVIDTELDRSGGMSKATVRNQTCFPDVHGQSVLVCVGELYSGEDLRAGVEFVANGGPKEITTMSLFSHPASIVDPNYVGKVTSRPLDAPWRITDEYRSRRL